MKMTRVFIYMGHNSLYNKYLELRDEILKHKWLESEKAGKDIGFEDALIDWNKKHRVKWVRSKVKDEKVQ